MQTHSAHSRVDKRSGKADAQLKDIHVGVYLYTHESRSLNALADNDYQELWKRFSINYKVNSGFKSTKTGRRGASHMSEVCMKACGVI